MVHTATSSGASSNALKEGKSQATDDGVDVSTTRVTYTYPMVKETDMGEGMKADVMDICTSACERHAENNESAAKMIKEILDKKFGTSWHVVVGEGFGFEVSYELENLMYMFFAGNLAVCAWKCSA